MKKLLLLQITLLVAAFNIAHADELKEQAPVPSENSKSWYDYQRYVEIASDGGGLVKEDFEKMDDILYKVVIIKPEELTTLEAKLNECGKDGWDLFNIYHRKNGDVQLILKKHAVSYLEKLKALR